MIVKHIVKPDKTFVFIAQSEYGTLLLEYNEDKFYFVQGFSLVTPHKCTFMLDNVKSTHSFIKACAWYDGVEAEEDNYEEKKRNIV